MTPTQFPTFGWYGKIPALGDFVTRRLPAGFVEPWDEWLSMQLENARSVLADAWPALYGRAPIVCFSVGADVIDAHAWQGILVPSTDRVGRRFPLTIVRALEAPATGVLSHLEWAALAAAGRQAAIHGCDADGLDRALAPLDAWVQASVPDAHPLPGGRMPSGAGAWWSWCADPRAIVPEQSVDLPVGANFLEVFGWPSAGRPA